MLMDYCSRIGASTAAGSCGGSGRCWQIDPHQVCTRKLDRLILPLNPSCMRCCRCLVKHHCKQSLSEIRGPVTVVTGAGGRGSSSLSQVLFHISISSSPTLLSLLQPPLTPRQVQRILMLEIIESGADTRRWSGAGKKRRVTYVECGNDLNSMLDLGKVCCGSWLCDASEDLFTRCSCMHQEILIINDIVYFHGCVLKRRCF